MKKLKRKLKDYLISENIEKDTPFYDVVSAFKSLTLNFFEKDKFSFSHYIITKISNSLTVIHDENTNTIFYLDFKNEKFILKAIVNDKNILILENFKCPFSIMMFLAKYRFFRIQIDILEEDMEKINFSDFIDIGNGCGIKYMNEKLMSKDEILDNLKI